MSEPRDECVICGGLPPGEASGAGDLCYCTPDDASREAATRMSVRGPSGSIQLTSLELQAINERLVRHVAELIQQLNAAEQQLATVQAAIREMVEEMDVAIGPFAPPTTLRDVLDWRDRLAALGAPQEQP